VASFGNQRVKIGEYANGTPKYVTRRHYAKIKLAEKRLGYPLTIVQGSYHTGVKASAGTHDGGGCLDLAPFDWKRKCRVFRELGDTAWHRPALKGVWSEHIHTVDMGCTNLRDIARSQVVDYRNKKDGLKGHRDDPQWRPDPIPVFKLTKKMATVIWPQKKVRRAKRVDLEKVRAQALAGGTKPNPGVKLIQLALNKALNRNLLIDGKFGEVTKTAYTAWQVILGFDVDDADGLPNQLSLTKLGKTRGAKFVVSL
jgi:hypothetical protein